MPQGPAEAVDALWLAQIRPSDCGSVESAQATARGQRAKLASCIAASFVPVAGKAQCCPAQLAHKPLHRIARVRGMATNAGQRLILLRADTIAGERMPDGRVTMVRGVHIDLGGSLGKACRHDQTLTFGGLRRGAQPVAGVAQRVHVRPQMHVEIRAVWIVADRAVGARRIVHELLVSRLVGVARDAKVDHPGFEQ